MGSSKVAPPVLSKNRLPSIKYMSTVYLYKKNTVDGLTVHQSQQNLGRPDNRRTRRRPLKIRSPKAGQAAQRGSGQCSWPRPARTAATGTSSRGTRPKACKTNPACEQMHWSTVSLFYSSSINLCFANVNC